MDEGSPASLEVEILLALRRSPRSRIDELAEAVGLPRTNFGRRLKNSLVTPLQQLLAEGFIEDDHGRYSLTEKGRRRLSARTNGLP
jgi:DNA-binding IclR family transcriptional regulator